MKRALLATILLAAAAMPQPVCALVVPDLTPSTCTADPTAVVQMPCARRTVQIETMRFALMKSLVPMHCRPVGMRFDVAGFSFDPGRGAGLIASALFSRSKHAHPQNVCEPTRL